MEKKIIYVVFGSTGEYSDRCEWMVKAFTDEEQAKELVMVAEQYAKQFDPYDFNSRQNATNPYDPKFSMDYTGTSYYYGSVELD